ncbi:aldehyde dehydrogenase family protein [Streptomyces sp. NPDC005373]|uniref:aldehyde dehydrogenase family protein n=1 Tax=Streptomyces sp. NPDC005373 TaxID=3156879 RepID=UPI0033B145A5
MTTRHDHWIDGKPSAPALGAYLPLRNPATRRQGDEVAAGSSSDVDLAVSAAVAAQPAWARRPALERAGTLHRIADAIEAHAEEFATLERSCTGKVATQLAAEVAMSAAYFRYYAGVLPAFHGRTVDQGAGTLTYTRHEPFGVVGVITPWNLPLNQACRALAPALATGNAVVAKPSEHTPVSTLLLARLASEAGLPDGVLGVVSGTGPDAGTPLAAHPDVRRVAFTGSVRVGRHLASLAADRLIPLTLELGGKSPLVVFADADLDRAAGAAAVALALNAGQVCSATTRLLVEDSVHDELVARVVERVERLVPGTDFGPMITEAQYEKVLGHFAEARAEGAVPVCGGGPFESGSAARGQFIRPTVYARVDPGLEVAREEVFGPILVTMPFTSEAEALDLANDTPYGLVAHVWSGDTARGLRLAEGIEAGQVSVNGGPLTIETPFGGFKQSGYGREKGFEALGEYTQTKTVSVCLSGGAAR